MKSLLRLPYWILLLIAIVMASEDLTAQEGEMRYGIVNVSVCNTRSEAEYSAGQESQALLGMPLEILDRHNEWTKIRTPEGYEHWTLSAALKRVDRERLSAWNQSEQVVVTQLITWVYERPSLRAQVVSDAVGGCRMKYLGRKKGFFWVEYPDGRQGFISKKDAQLLSQWRREVSRDAESILATAHSLMGIPYMWGGTSPKGVDCSGFVRTVLYMHDLILPRNASQQARVGERLQIAPDYSNLQPGDLLFFGSKNKDGSAKRVVHVGISMGGTRFIHSLGCVHTGSFNPADADYDGYEQNRLLFAARILPHVNQDPQIQTTDRIPLYQ
ncbi:MAG: NlpC/P60 family protein [Bacteroidaceae bacterium]